MLKYASLIGAGLLACGLSQQAQATSVAYDLDFLFNGVEVTTGTVFLNFSTIQQAESATVSLPSQTTHDVTTFLAIQTGNFVINGTNYGAFDFSGSSNLVSGSYGLDIGAQGQLYGLSLQENGLTLTYALDTTQSSFNIDKGGATQGGNLINGQVIIGNDSPYTVTPIPAGLPLVAGGLGLVGWFSRGRKQKAALAA